MLVVLVVIHGVSCVCLWGVFLFLCAGGVCLCLVYLHPVIVLSAVMHPRPPGRHIGIDS